MGYLLMSGEPPRDYESFLLELLEAMRERGARGIAVAILPERTGEDVLTAYWNMSVCDKAYAAVHIHFDAVDGLVAANMDKYTGRGEETDDGRDDGD